MSNENVRKHLLRLMWYIHPHLPPDRLEAAMEALEPDKDVSAPRFGLEFLVLPVPIIDVSKKKKGLFRVPLPKKFSLY